MGSRVRLGILPDVGTMRVVAALGLVLVALAAVCSGARKSNGLRIKPGTDVPWTPGGTQFGALLDHNLRSESFRAPKGKFTTKGKHKALYMLRTFRRRKGKKASVEGANNKRSIPSPHREITPPRRPREEIDRLNMRLCMTSWDAAPPTNANYLHQLTACVAGLSSIGKAKAKLESALRDATKIETRRSPTPVASASRSRFCTHGRNWLCSPSKKKSKP